MVILNPFLILFWILNVPYNLLMLVIKLHLIYQVIIISRVITHIRCWCINLWICYRLIKLSALKVVSWKTIWIRKNFRCNIPVTYVIWSLQRCWRGTYSAFWAVFWLVSLPLLRLIVSLLSISNLTWVSTIAVIVSSFLTAGIVHGTIQIVNRKRCNFLVLCWWLWVLWIKGRP